MYNLNSASNSWNVFHSSFNIVFPLSVYYYGLLSPCLMWQLQCVFFRSSSPLPVLRVLGFSSSPCSSLSCPRVFWSSPRLPLLVFLSCCWLCSHHGLQVCPSNLCSASQAAYCRFMITQLTDIASVSYTHLDVYKRQVYYLIVVHWI